MEKNKISKIVLIIVLLIVSFVILLTTYKTISWNNNKVYNYLYWSKWVKIYQNDTKDVSIIDVDLKEWFVRFGWVIDSWDKKFERNLVNEFTTKSKNINPDFFEKWYRLIASVNWQFFNDQINPTVLSYPVKSNWKIITDYVDNDNQKRTLIIDKNKKVKLIDWYDKSSLTNPNNSEIIVWLSPHQNMWAETELWRTFVWVTSENKILFFIAKQKTQLEMMKILNDYWIANEQIMMLDWWPSSQFAYDEIFQLWWELSSFYWESPVPQFIMIYVNN